MSGTIPLSLTQQFDEFAQPLSGGQLYIIQAGTVATPQNAYADSALTIPLPNPIPLDAAGRIPQFFLADGQIKVRLQDKNGLVQLAADNILVIGPSGGGGGGGGVDPTTVWGTGDLKVRYDIAVIAGFVRANGRTIGSSFSGATELADATAQALFQHLWLVDSTLPVIPSRGATAAADWAANKQITLPDWRGCALAALDDMGNAASGRLTSTYFGVAPTVLGARGGLENNVLTTDKMPAHYHSAGIYDPTHNHSVNNHSYWTTASGSGVGGGGAFGVAGTTSISINAAATGVRVNSSNGLDTTYSTGGGGAHANVQPTKLATIYIKL
ncbi:MULTISPECIES: hypothetical protein [unclassified Bradyrhizobium]|uniref:hypothetical protein n=1 Tax=unclassified Bradyrhizobium TaxID=2631580 RepID=UPI002FF0DAD3